MPKHVTYGQNVSLKKFSTVCVLMQTVIWRHICNSLTPNYEFAKAKYISYQSFSQNTKKKQSNCDKNIAIKLI